MIRSTRPSSLSRAKLSSLLVSNSRALAAIKSPAAGSIATGIGGRGLLASGFVADVSLAAELSAMGSGAGIVWGMPLAKPWRRAAMIAPQLRLASRPPFKMAPLPERIAREAIWIAASGRASKITPTTPRGTVSRSSTRPWSSSVCSCRRPRGSSRAATWRTPAIAASSLAPSNFSRAIRAGANPSEAAASISAWLAARIKWRSLSKAEAIASTAARRSASLHWPRAMALRRTPAARCNNSGLGSGTGAMPRAAELIQIGRGRRPSSQSTARPGAVARPKLVSGQPVAGQQRRPQTAGTVAQLATPDFQLLAAYRQHPLLHLSP